MAVTWCMPANFMLMALLPLFPSARTVPVGV
jgi:hypothetical protein